MAVVGLRRLLVAFRLAEELGLDAELADLQARVGLELDLRSRHQREPVVTRLLEQVIRQLLLERDLVALELLAVAFGEKDHVVVRHIDARDRDGLVLLHLLGELAGKLDRLDMRLERPVEGALDEPLDLLLEAPQQAH